MEEQSFKTLTFINHPPIRMLAGNRPQEHFIHPGGYGIGGETLLAYRNQRGEYLIWLRNVSCYDVPTTRTFIGKFRPGSKDALESDGFKSIFSNMSEYGPVEGWEPYSVLERGEIQVWLDSLGLSSIEEFD